MNSFISMTKFQPIISRFVESLTVQLEMRERKRKLRVRVRVFVRECEVRECVSERECE